MINKLFNLKGQTAMVTGGSSGIGYTLAEALVEAGVAVAIVNRSEDKGRAAAAEIGREGGRVMAVAADVSKLAEVEAAAARVEGELGPLDILVNSHGVNIRKSALDFDTETWRRVIEINLDGVFHTCQAVGRRMVERGRGRIVNISSIVSLIGMTDRPAYCASKGGVTQLTKALALEWAASGVRVNAIGPGFIRTPLTEAIIEAPDFDDKIKALAPLGRVGEPRDLVGLMLVLCSPAGDYITGQTMYVDGGWSVW